MAFYNWFPIIPANDGKPLFVAGMIEVEMAKMVASSS